jgi:phage-related protein
MIYINLEYKITYFEDRIFFFTFIGKNIILLHGFLKQTEKTPESEIIKAMNNYYKVLNNRNAYEDQTKY